LQSPGSNNFPLLILDEPSSTVLVDVNISKENMTTKLMKLPDVLTRVAISRSKLYAKVKEGTFPAPISLGARAVAWVEQEVEDWIAALVAKSRVERGLKREGV
jgi:prophage regulatory protein